MASAAAAPGASSPALAAFKSYDFGGIALRVRQGLPPGADRSENELGVPQYGLRTWDSSVLVCRMLELGLLAPTGSAAVVELGAGPGLPGLLLAEQRRRWRQRHGEIDGGGGAPKKDAQHDPPQQFSSPPPPILLTDFDPGVLENLRLNIEANGLERARDGLEVAKLDWRAPEECSALRSLGVVEWVIGCDLLYEETQALHRDLLRTIRLLCRQGRRGSGSADEANAALCADNKPAAARTKPTLLPAPPKCRVILAYQRRRFPGTSVLLANEDANFTWFDTEPIEDVSGEALFIRLARVWGFEVEGPLSLPPEVGRDSAVPENLEVVILRPAAGAEEAEEEDKRRRESATTTPGGGQQFLPAKL